MSVIWRSTVLGRDKFKETTNSSYKAITYILIFLYYYFNCLFFPFDLLLFVPYDKLVQNCLA